MQIRIFVVVSLVELIAVMGLVIGRAAWAGFSGFQGRGFVYMETNMILCFHFGCLTFSYIVYRRPQKEDSTQESKENHALDADRALQGLSDPHSWTMPLWQIKKEKEKETEKE